MSTTKKFIKSAQRLIRNVLQLGKRLTKQVMNWLLRNLFVFRRHANTSQAGFVLPTVIMVLLVVTLLTTAILFRSFDRAKNASNVRVNQATLSAATPALDRAKAKIEMLLADPNLPRGTPGDSAFYSVIEPKDDDDNDGKFNKFDLPGETRLQITDPKITDPGEKTGNTGWLFPVDTDNNGKFDSVTVYSILYKYGKENEKTPLKARSLPMTTGNVNPACAAAEGTSASLIGGGGWVDVGGTLKKSIFVYVATVPITDDDIPGYNSTDYELYQKGNKGFSALELQADIARIPLSNNAVVYEDDVEIFSGGEFNLNGRIFTNSNLFVANLGNGLTFRQVSSPDSCFYEEENSKMVAGGHVGYGTIAKVSNSTSGSANVHLFQGRGKKPDLGATLSTNNQSATGTPAQIAYNNNAYEQRIAGLVAAAGNDLPEAVDTAIKNFIEEDGLDEGEAKEKALDRYFRERTRRVPYAEVPYGEDDDDIAISVEGEGEDLRPSQELMYPYDPDDGKTPTAANVSLKTAGSKLKPAATKFATQEQQGTEEFVGDRVLMGHNLPELRYDEEEEEWLGDEEPQDIEGTVWDEPDEGPRQRKTRVTTLADAGDTTRNGFWENAAADQPKDKFDPRGGLRVVTGAGVYLPDLAPGEVLSNAASNIVWPDWMPVINPANPGTGIPAIAPLVDFDRNPGATRIVDIITAVRSEISAIPPGDVKFSDYADALPPSTEVPLEIDVTTPIPTILKRPFKRMNAAAVYHYNHAEGQDPIACVATYYDPTDWQSARNLRGAGGPTFADVSGDTSVQPGGARPSTDIGTGGARSVNGITFKPPTGDAPRNVMNYLRNQVYPNGRYVNPMLREATDPNGSKRRGNLNLAQKAAYDSTNCALHIYGELSGAMSIGTSKAMIPTSGYPLPHGTIQETAFLDARQIKAVDGQPDTTNTALTDYSLTANYDLPIEQRYPLEIRATVLDLDQLRQISTPQSPYGDQEYMLPNSGIIYATRDDALADATDPDAKPLTREDSKPKLAATDFLLDPTRRPNGIMLVNGARLWREREFRQVEKGLTVATNLPIYIKAQPAGDTDDGETLEGFNPHQKPSGQLQQEFTKEVTPASSDNDFYGRTEAQLNKNFACRKDDPRLPCPVGDDWRPATVLSDGITLLSSSFREGFRNEGDYDLRNNQIDNVNNLTVAGGLPRGDADGSGNPDIDSGQRIEARRLWNGFWNNDFAINGLSSNQTGSVFPPATDGYPSAPTDRLDDITPAAFPTGLQLTDQDYSTNNGTPLNSSYFNNMVTPVQRRVAGFPEYVMEYCPKTLVSECQPTDWIIGLQPPVGASPPILLDAGPPAEANSWDVVALNYSIKQVGGQSVATDNSPINPSSAKVPQLDDSDDVNVNSGVQLIAGTTATPPQGNAIGKPRRIAFLRDPNGDLIFDGNNNPIPLGIAANGTVQPFPYSEVDNSNSSKRLQFREDQPTTPLEAGEFPIPNTVALKYNTLVLCEYRKRSTSCPSFGSSPAPNTSSGAGGFNTPRVVPAPQEALWFASVSGNNPTNPGASTFRPDFPLFYQGIADQEGIAIHNKGTTKTTTYTDRSATPVWHNGQPLVVPVVQLQATTQVPNNPPASSGHRNAGTVHWIPRATESPAPEDTTIFNLVLASKDSPSRPEKGGHEGDIGGALHLMPRFLENWTTTGQAVQIDGSFIQIGRSFYATAPYYQLPNTNDSDNSLFGALGYPPYYRSGNERKLPAYEAPRRSFGFDVGLLSQIPDLFGQNFAIPPDEEPTTFFREVSRDDPWLEPLLCAEVLEEDGSTTGFALPEKERPSSCR